MLPSQDRAHVMPGGKQYALRVTGVKLPVAVVQSANPDQQSGPRAEQLSTARSAALAHSSTAQVGWKPVGVHPLRFRPDPALWRLPFDAVTSPPLLRPDALLQYAGPTAAQRSVPYYGPPPPNCCLYCCHSRSRNRPMLVCDTCGMMVHIGESQARHAGPGPRCTCHAPPSLPTECTVAVDHEPLWGDSAYCFQCCLCGQGVERYYRLEARNWMEVLQVAALNLLVSQSLAHESMLVAEMKRVGAIASDAVDTSSDLHGVLSTLLNTKDPSPRRLLALAAYFQAPETLMRMVRRLAPVLLWHAGGETCIAEGQEAELPGHLQSSASVFINGADKVFCNPGHWTLAPGGIPQGKDGFLPPTPSIVVMLQGSLMTDAFAMHGLVDGREATFNMLVPPIPSDSGNLDSAGVDPLMRAAMDGMTSKGYRMSNVGMRSGDSSVNVSAIDALPDSASASPAAGQDGSGAPASHLAGDEMPSSSQAAALSALLPATTRDGQMLRVLNGNEPRASAETVRRAQGAATFLHPTPASVQWRTSLLSAIASGHLPPVTARMLDAGDRKGFTYTGAVVWGRVPLAWIASRLPEQVQADAARACSRADDKDGASTPTSSSAASSAGAAESLMAACPAIKGLLAWWPLQVVASPAQTGSLTHTLPFGCAQQLWVDTQDLLPLSKSPMRALRVQVEEVYADKSAPSAEPTPSPSARRLNPTRGSRHGSRATISGKQLGALPAVLCPVFLAALSNALVTVAVTLVPGGVGTLGQWGAAREAEPAQGPGLENLATIASMVSLGHFGEPEKTVVGAAGALLRQLAVFKACIGQVLRESPDEAALLRQALLQAAGRAAIAADGLHSPTPHVPLLPEAASEQAERSTPQASRSLTIRPSLSNGSNPSESSTCTRQLPALRANLPKGTALKCDEYPGGAKRGSVDDQGPQKKHADAEFVPAAGKNASAAARLLKRLGASTAQLHVGDIPIIATSAPPDSLSCSAQERSFQRGAIGQFLGATCTPGAATPTSGAGALGGHKRPRPDFQTGAVFSGDLIIPPSSLVQVSTAADEAAGDGRAARGRILAERAASTLDALPEQLRQQGQKRRRLQRLWRGPLKSFACQHVLRSDWLLPNTDTAPDAPEEVEDDASSCGTLASDATEVLAMEAVQGGLCEAATEPGGRCPPGLSAPHLQLTGTPPADLLRLLDSEEVLPDPTPLMSMAGPTSLGGDIPPATVPCMARFLTAWAGAPRRGTVTAPASPTREGAESPMSDTSLAHRVQMQRPARLPPGGRMPPGQAHPSFAHSGSASSGSVTEESSAEDAGSVVESDGGDGGPAPRARPPPPLLLCRGAVLREALAGQLEQVSGPNVRKMLSKALDKALGVQEADCAAFGFKGQAAVEQGGAGLEQEVLAASPAGSGGQDHTSSQHSSGESGSPELPAHPPQSQAESSSSRSPGDGSEDGNIFVIDRIIRHKTVRRKRKFYVSWKGYDSQYNSWVSRENILDKSVITEYDEHRQQRRKARIARMRVAAVKRHTPPSQESGKDQGPPGSRDSHGGSGSDRGHDAGAGDSSDDSEDA